MLPKVLSVLDFFLSTCIDFRLSALASSFKASRELFSDPAAVSAAHVVKYTIEDRVDVQWFLAQAMLIFDVPSAGATILPEASPSSSTPSSPSSLHRAQSFFRSEAPPTAPPMETTEEPEDLPPALHQLLLRVLINLTLAPAITVTTRAIQVLLRVCHLRAELLDSVQQVQILIKDANIQVSCERERERDREAERQRETKTETER
jgi:hypothetical protein